MHFRIHQATPNGNRIHQLNGSFDSLIAVAFWAEWGGLQLRCRIKNVMKRANNMSAGKRRRSRTTTRKKKKKEQRGRGFIAARGRAVSRFGETSKEWKAWEF